MIHLKGSPKGIVLSVDDTDYNTGREELRAKLEASKTFFRGANLEVFITSNTLTEAEVYFLRDTVSDVLDETTVHFIESAPKMLPQKHSPLEDLAKDEGITKYVRHGVKSGETLEYDDNLVIIGDVEEGAKVIAGGNVVVIGTLMGKVHAGAGGRRDAFVVATKLMPSSLIIGSLSASVKTGPLKKILTGTPEIAYIRKNAIKIEQYT